jgi:two-component system CheB/CheR fusion protein
MEDEDKSKEQLLRELKDLQKSFTKLKSSEIEHLRMEEQIKYARKYAESIIATVREPLIVLTSSLNVVSANRSFYKTFKVKPEETDNQFLYDLGNHQWDIPKLRKSLEETLSKNITIEKFEIDHDFENIGRKIMLLNARKIKGGAVKGEELILLAVEDITERKLIEEKLREIQKELLLKEQLATIGLFSVSISHELRNPLAVISSSIYYLNMKLKDTDEKVQEHLDRLKNNLDKAANIITHILNLTHLRKPEQYQYDLISLTSNGVGNCKIPKKINVITKYPDKEIFIYADMEQIHMALTNIIDNAVDAMNSEGTLTVSINKTKDGYAELAFEDTGPGIPQDNLEKVFQPLFSTKPRGIGFGLAITKLIIENHNGTIKAESKVGEGTIIKMYIPLDINKN